MADWAKLIEAIANLVGALAWPIAVVLAVWLIMRRHQVAFGRLIDRVTSFSFPGGQIDLAEIEAAQEARVEELVEQAVSPETDETARQDAVRALSTEAEQLGRLRRANRYFRVHCPNCMFEFSTRIRRGATCLNCGHPFSYEELRAQAQTQEGEPSSKASLE